MYLRLTLHKLAFYKMRVLSVNCAVRSVWINFNFVLTEEKILRRRFLLHIMKPFHKGFQFLSNDLSAMVSTFKFAFKVVIPFYPISNFHVNCELQIITCDL